MAAVDPSIRGLTPTGEAPPAAPTISQSLAQATRRRVMSQSLPGEGIGVYNINQGMEILGEQKTEKKSTSLSSKLNALFQSKNSRTESKSEGLMEGKLVALKGFIKTAVTSLKQSAAKSPQNIKQSFDMSARKVYENLQNALDSRSRSKIARNLPGVIEQQTGISNSNDKSIQKEIKKTLDVAAKEMKKNEVKEVNIPSLNDHTVIMLKKGNGKIDVFVKGKLLGNGSFGEVYSTSSARTGKEKVIKTAKLFVKEGHTADPDDTAAQDELKNEIKILKILNKNGPQEGVQKKIIGSDNITISERYTEKDFQKQIETMRMAKYLGVNYTDLKKMDDSAIKEKIAQKVNELSQEISSLRKQINQKTEELLDAQLLGASDAELHVLEMDKKSIEKQLTARIDREVDMINLTNRELLGNKKGDELENNGNIVGKQLLIPTNEENVNRILQKLFGDVLFQAAKSCQELDTVDLKQRMSLASNIVTGLLYIHSQGIIHGDLKPKNFFWNKGSAVIADFGGAIVRGSDKYEPSTSKGYRAGSYIDAINFFHKTKDEESLFLAGKALDIRATGISLYEMFTGNSIPIEKKVESASGAFYNPETYQAMAKAMKEAGVPDEIADIITKMATPLPFDKDNPQNFKVPVEESELIQLAQYLKTLPPTT